MQRRTSLLATALLLVALLPGASTAQINTNRDPEANAGPDQAVGENVAVFLNASASRDLDLEDRENLRYVWRLKDCQPAVAACSSVTLQSPKTVRPCFVTPTLKPGETNALQFTFEVYVDDGKAPNYANWPTPNPSPGTSTAPPGLPPEVQVDDVRVTVGNVDQPPHGAAAGTPATCTQPFVPSPLTLAVTPLDVDCLEGRGQAVRFTFAGGVFDDNGAVGGVAVASLRPGDNLSVPMHARTPTTVPSGIWAGQTNTPMEGIHPVDDPWFRAGTYKIDAMAFDASGGSGGIGEQEPELTISCDYDEVYGFDLELVGETETETSRPAACFQPGDGAPTATKYLPVALGPNGILRVEPKFQLLEGATAPDGVSNHTAASLLLHKVTYTVCVGAGAKRILGPEVTLPAPWFLDIGSVPAGAQEILFRGYSRDNREVKVLVQLTADETPPEVLVVVPTETFFGVPFDLTIYIHDALDVNATLEMREVDLDTLTLGQQPRVTLSAKDPRFPPSFAPALAGAKRLDIPTLVAGRYVFDRIDDFLYDTDRDGVPDGYYDMMSRRSVNFAERDCTQDGVADLFIPGPDGTPCSDDDVVLTLEACPSNAVDPKSILDGNGNGRCDRNVRQPDGSIRSEAIIGLLTPQGQKHVGLLQGREGDPVLTEFLQSAPSTVFRVPVRRVAGLTDCDGDLELDAYLDYDLDGRCAPNNERRVSSEGYDDLALFRDFAVQQLGTTDYRLRVQDSAGNSVQFTPRQEIEARTGVLTYELAPPIHFTEEWPEAFAAGIRVLVAGRPWTTVPDNPVGTEVYVDRLNHTLQLGQALPSRTQVLVSFPTIVTSVLVRADSHLDKIVLEGREPRFSVLEDGDLVPGESFQPAPKRRTDPPLGLLPGDVIRFNATVTQQGGTRPIAVGVTFDGEDGTTCSADGEPAYLVLAVRETDTICHRASFNPGTHTVTAEAALLSQLDIETDPSDQVENVTFEVYAGMVRYTPPGQTLPLEFYIRADHRGLVRLQGGALDLKNDRSYDLRLVDDYVLRDGQGRTREIDGYTFTYVQTETVAGNTVTSNVTLYWDPLESCDIQALALCGPNAKDVFAKDAGDCERGDTCRPITVVPTVKADVEKKDSPGMGAFVALALVGLLAGLRRRRA